MSFASDGIASTCYYNWDRFYSVAIRARSQDRGGGVWRRGFRLLFFHSQVSPLTGNLDQSSSSDDHDGMIFTDIPGGDDGAYSVAIQSDGKIVVAGDSGGDFAVVRCSTLTGTWIRPLAATES